MKSGRFCLLPHFEEKLLDFKAFWSATPSGPSFKQKYHSSLQGSENISSGVAVPLKKSTVSEFWWHVKGGLVLTSFSGSPGPAWHAASQMLVVQQCWKHKKSRPSPCHTEWLYLSTPTFWKKGPWLEGICSAPPQGPSSHQKCHSSLNKGFYLTSNMPYCTSCILAL